MRNLFGGFAFPLCLLDTLTRITGFAIPKEFLKALSVRPGVFPCDFGASSVSFRVSGFGFGSLFSLRPSGLPFPLGGFSVRPVLAVGFSLSPAVLLHLASFLFRLRKQHCRKPGCNDPGPCRPSIWTVTPDPSPAGSRRGDGPDGRPAG